MTILSSNPARPSTKAPKGKAAKAARKAEEASWWTQPIPAQVSLSDAGKVDDRGPRRTSGLDLAELRRKMFAAQDEHTANHPRSAPLSDKRLAKLFGVTEMDILAASCLRSPAAKVEPRHLAAVADGTRAELWPTNVQLGQTVRELIEAGRENELPALARSCGVTENELYACANDYICQTTGALRLVRSPEQVAAERAVIVRRVGKVANEPTWCERDHDGEEVSIDGFVLSALHERRMALLVSEDPKSCDGTTATAGVYIESCDDSTGQPADDSPPRVILSLGDGTYGDEFPTHGQQGTQGWTAPTEHIRALAAALVAACDLVDGK